MPFLLSAVRRLAGRGPVARRLAGVAAVAALALAAACSENVEGGAGCPALCPVTNETVRDTVLEPVVLDTSLAGVPVAGDVTQLLLAVQPGADSLDVRAVVRFDSLPAKYAPPAGGDSVAITAIAGTGIRFSVDTSGTRFTDPVTLEAYDVDTASAADTSSAVLAALFRPDRLLGSTTLAPGAITGDTIRIPISDAAVVAKAQTGRRLRVGVRLVSTTAARVRLFGVRASGTTGSLAPVVRFDPATDTTVSYVPVFASSSTPGNPTVAAAYLDQTVVARTPRAAVGSDLVIGGFPARRVFMRFAVPARFVDSVDVVRAQLILTQRPAPGVDPLDSVVVRPLAVVATDAVPDLVRASELATTAVGLDTVRFVPNGSGARELPIVNLVRAWRTGVLPAATQRALVLRAAGEGVQAGEVRFYSTEAPAGLRPRLRLSYVPRSSFGLP